MRASAAKYSVLICTYIKAYQRYPLELFLKLVYLPVQMMMYIFLWKTVASGRQVDFVYMVCYYLFSTLLGYAFPFAHIAGDIQNDVMEGSITNYLVRPMYYITPVVARYIAWMCCYAVVFVPAIVFVGIYRGVELKNILLFFCYLIPGAAVEFLLWYNVGLAAIRLERIRGVMMAVRAVRALVSGSLLPLSFFPQGLKEVGMMLPFRLYIYTPIDVLLNGTNLRNAMTDLPVAVFWIGGLFLFAHLQWKTGIQELGINQS